MHNPASPLSRALLAKEPEERNAKPKQNNLLNSREMVRVATMTRLPKRSRLKVTLLLRATTGQGFTTSARLSLCPQEVACNGGSCAVTTFFRTMTGDSSSGLGLRDRERDTLLVRTSPPPSALNG